MKTIAIAGTFDTKGREYQYVKNLIESMGCRTFTINTGVYEPFFTPDVSNDEVAKAAGALIQEIADRHDRGFATEPFPKEWPNYYLNFMQKVYLTAYCHSAGQEELLL